MFFIEMLETCVTSISDIIWGWPLILAFMAIGLITTVALNFVQFRYFFHSWKLVLFPGKAAQIKQTGAVMTPFQAFINALGSSTGNGSIAGIATAIAAGGPGAAFWILIAGIIGLVLRFCEVYLATYVIGKYTFRNAQGGPMVYLSIIPGGRFLPYVFTICMLLYGLSSGNAMQANAIGLGIFSSWQINPLITATVMLLFIAYTMFGGADRILKISDKLVPFKVALFMISFFIVLGFHYASLWQALKLIFASALTPAAVGGAVVGFTVQQAIRWGFTRTLNANEAGLGSAAVFFGSSGATNPVRTSIMAMLGTFISSYLVCFVVALAIIASGVWSSGLTSTALTAEAFKTVFGVYGGWLVTFIAASFGLGVLVAFSLVTRESWLFLTKNRYLWLFNILYCLITFGGTLAKVDLIWCMNDIVNGLLLAMNLFAIIWLLPVIRRGLKEYQKS